mgnify:CR=1 FL=1
MKVKASEIVAGFLTTIIFVVIFSFLLGFPSVFPTLDDFKNLFVQSAVGSVVPVNNSTVNTSKPKKKPTVTSAASRAKVIDNYNGVDIYYNGKVSNITGRHITPDGYNLGLKYQCVEFVKRYYYEYFDHKMPDSYGNAKDFYNTALSDGDYNRSRDLTQYSNGSYSSPQEGDLIVFGPTQWNRFGHVAIVSEVYDHEVEIVQQNPGFKNSSRQVFPLSADGGQYRIDNPYVLGWLRKE